MDIKKKNLPPFLSVYLGNPWGLENKDETERERKKGQKQ